MTAAVGGGGPGGERACPRCGLPLAPQAAFCRGCGARYETPAAPPPQARGQRPGRAALWLGAAIVVVGAGVAAAIVVASGGGSSSTTVITTAGASAPRSAAAATTPARAPSDSIEAGRYLQAGSFKAVADADTEQRRLAAAGIEVEVVDSEVAQQLYPGFQVLLGGPVSSTGAEASLLRQLHHQGVPSAFGRELTPAREITEPAAIAGSWTGKLERSSTSRPGLDGSLPATLTVTANGGEGKLEFPSIHCSTNLTAAPSTTVTLSYRQDEECVGPGTWRARPSGGKLMLTLLPPGSDLIVLGSLDPND